MRWDVLLQGDFPEGEEDGDPSGCQEPKRAGDRDRSTDGIDSARKAAITRQMAATRSAWTGRIRNSTRTAGITGRMLEMIPKSDRPTFQRALGQWLANFEPPSSEGRATP